MGDDNYMPMRFPQGKSKALTLSYDDGVEQDIQLIKLLDTYGVKCTFNLNSGIYAPEGTIHPPGRIHRRLTELQSTSLYNHPLVEVAVHSLTHPHLENLPSATVMKQILQDRENLERQFGCIVRGMAYPYGTYNDTVVDVLRLAGIAYSRTVHSHQSFALPHDWHRWGGTCHHRNPQLMTLAQKFLTETPERDPYLFYLWGHSYEFEEYDDWDLIEDFLRLVSANDQVWYATNMEIYDYTMAYERLEYSTDLHIIYNPSAIDVWIHTGKEIIKIPSGKSVPT